MSNDKSKLTNSFQMELVKIYEEDVSFHICFEKKYTDVAMHNDSEFSTLESAGYIHKDIIQYV